METLSMLSYAIILGVSFIVALLVGAGLAKLLGYDLNEPEYYQTKENKHDDSK